MCIDYEKEIKQLQYELKYKDSYIEFLKSEIKELEDKIDEQKHDKKDKQNQGDR